VTGFMIVFFLVNGETSLRFITNATRTIAIIAVFIALAGLSELFLLNHLGTALAETSPSPSNLRLPRISSTLGNPVILSTYLVLGFPLLLCQLSYAYRRHLRDFWLIASTIVFVSIILTQTRLGILSLAITGSIFFYKNSKHQLITFIFSFAILFLILSSIAGPRYSPIKIWLECREAVTSSLTYLSAMPLERLLIGVGANGTKKLNSLDASGVTGIQEAERPLSSNMHLALIIENGLIGWAIMMWILIGALRTLYIAYKIIHDLRLKMIVWAIFSSITGFAFSMNSRTLFFNISIQVLFWGLLGMGVAIGVRFSPKKPAFIRVWKFGD
jgi:hypothetical protein